MELMVQRGFVYGFDGDRTRCFLVWVPPLATPSTSAWHYFAGVTGLLPLLRSLKPEGVVITHYAFDRAGFAALSRLLEQYQNLYTKASTQPGPKRYITDLAQLFIATGCALHDCAGGIRWGARTQTPLDKHDAKGFYRDLHISLAALRNGYDVLIGGIPDLLEMLLWEPDVVALAGAADMWSLLGIVDAAVVSDLVLLCPRIRDGRIVCNASCKMWPDSVTRVSATHMYCWKLRSFTDTRFGGLGKCLRPLIVALLLGTDHYVKALLEAGCKRNSWAALRG